ncbi:MAG: hypothetical protein P8X98_11665 [Woeseiaceae bacterium]
MYVAWLNPIDGVPVTDIWDRQIGTGEASTANVLEIHFKPVDHKFVRDTVQELIDIVMYLQPKYDVGVPAYEYRVYPTP